MPVKASPEAQKQLLRVQALDTRLRQLAHASATLPQRAELAALTPEIEAVRARHLGATGGLEDARTELKRAESDVAVVEARIARDGDRVQHTASVKDVTALESELSALAKRRSDLEDIELAVMERIDTFETELAGLDAERDELGARAAALEAAIDAGQATIERDRAAATADRAAVASTIDDQLLALYEKQRDRYGIGAAALVHGVSMGSNVKLAPVDLDVVRRAAPDDVVLCPDSGAILVRDENSGL
jgi:Zn-ribbon protein, possibly nucleic acid-binding